MAPWMINCKEYSQLVSKELDRPLPLWERLSVKMHGWICPACHHVKKQLDTLRQACRFAPSDKSCETDQNCVLPDDACLRIKAALKKLSE